MIPSLPRQLQQLARQVSQLKTEKDPTEQQLVLVLNKLLSRFSVHTVSSTKVDVQQLAWHAASERERSFTLVYVKYVFVYSKYWYCNENGKL